MAENWNLTHVEPLDDTNYFLWSEKIEGILRAKKLWKKVINVKAVEKPQEGQDDYNEKFKTWNEWDDDNYAARAVIINTMSKAQLLKYSHEKSADKLWSLIKNNMAAETEQIKARSLSELTSIRMSKEESIDAYVNRAEALKNQCVQLGRNIEDYELKMYIIKGLRQEFDQNVRVLETQRDITINDIRYALKQEEIRKSKRKEEKTYKEENVRKAREKCKGDITCYNCGKKGHTSSECRNKQKCYNCQGFNHIAADCKEQKKYIPQRRGYSRGRARGRGRGQNETILKTEDETVLTVTERILKSTHKMNQIYKHGINDDFKDCTWLLDSGATSHMVSDKLMFENIEDEKRDIFLADRDGKRLISDGRGQIMIKQSKENKITLKNVLFVPDINTNLLSVAKITDHGYNVNFNKYGAIVYKGEDDVKLTAVREGNAYFVNSTIINGEGAAVSEDSDIWHRRLGHANMRIIQEMKNENLVYGMGEDSGEMIQCEACMEGKMCRKVHPRLPGRRTNRIMELWHMDLVGPIKPSSRGGKNYIFTIVDDYSRVTFIELLSKKDEAAEKLKTLIIKKENQSELKLKAIRSDNGGEFIGEDLKVWMKKKGIKHEFSPARTPQCNGVVERTNKSIIEITRTLMADSEMPLDFWAEAACSAVHVENRSKSSVHGKTPYEMWNKKKPNIKYLRRFGCLAYLLDKETGRKKFESKAIKGIFVGYSPNNTYRIFVPETGKIKTDCDVRFDERRNGCQLLKTRIEEKGETDRKIIIEMEAREENPTIEDHEDIEENNEEERIETDDSIYEDTVGEELDVGYDMEERIRNEDHLDMRRNDNLDGIYEPQIDLRKAGRPKGTTKAVMEMRTREERKEEERRLEQRDVRRSERIKNQQLALMIKDEEIPKNIDEAKKSIYWKHWEEAIKEELMSMEKHKVWVIESRPAKKKMIKCKWIFNIKEDPSTLQRRYKARLVALGCGQRPGMDYGETFAPVVRIETIRLLFSISTMNERKIMSYDVKTAFLHGALKEEIYMELPEGLESNKIKNVKHVCKLNKSIYGFKQAGRCWNEHLTEILLAAGLNQSKEDPCLFYARSKDKFLYCGIHVDDMITVSSDDEFEMSIIEKIKRHLDITSQGEAKNVLGMQVNQKGKKIFVHQKNYINKLLQMYGMKDCNIVRSPMDVNVKMEEYEESERVDIRTYQELMGRLMYLSVYTRPDLSFALSCLSQFNNDPRTIHMSALKRIIRYLKGTANYCLEYGKNTNKGIECEADASWDRTKDAKSFTGLLIYMNGDLTHWKSKKQSTDALSSTESELEAMLDGLKEIQWTSRLLNEIGMSARLSMELRCDNLNAVKLANGGNFKTKSKLLNRKCHYIREIVNGENIFVKHIGSDEMTADCLTKPLSGPSLLRHATNFMDTEGR